MTPTPHIFNQQAPRVTFIGVDLETTDSDPSRAKIVQFAALAQRQGQTLHEADFLIDPSCPIPTSATKILGAWVAPQATASTPSAPRRVASGRTRMLS